MRFEMYHSCITVLDLDKSVKFYEEALKLKETNRIEAEDGSYAIVFMGTEGIDCLLEITWYKEMDRPYNLGDNEMHVGFRVDDYEAAKALHEKMGCICFENKDMGIYFIEDPDGYWMEVVPAK